MFKPRKLILFGFVNLFLLSLGEATQLDRVEEKLNDIYSKLSRIQSSLAAKHETSAFSIPPKFQKIGSRYFYVEKTERLDWESAGSTCRQMGGYLASFQSQQELDAIRSKLVESENYWLGIRREGSLVHQFVSTASGQKAKFLNWDAGQPSHTFEHVFLRGGQMTTWAPRALWLFICQADNDV